MKFILKIISSFILVIFEIILKIRKMKRGIKNEFLPSLPDLKGRYRREHQMSYYCKSLKVLKFWEMSIITIIYIIKQLC